MPDEDEAIKIAARIEKQSHFSQAYGAIDGILILFLIILTCIT